MKKNLKIQIKKQLNPDLLSVVIVKMNNCFQNKFAFKIYDFKL